MSCAVSDPAAEYSAGKVRLSVGKSGRGGRCVGGAEVKRLTKTSAASAQVEKPSQYVRQIIMSLRI
jgi:hypothetical protein